MATEVNLPELGESVTEGTVTRWLKQVGDEVAVDEPLLEVSTDKVDTEIPSPVAGTLLEIKAHEDDIVDVGAVLALVGSADEAGSSGDSDGDGGGEEAPGEQAEEQAEERAEEQPAQTTQEEPAETPLDQERTERDEAHAQAEQADTPDEPTGGEEQPAEPVEQQKDEAPREEVAAAAAGAAQTSGDRTVVRLPELGESVTEGTVTRWLKQVGDEVAVDESLLEVSTDKVDTEIPSPAAGTLLEINVSEDETVDVGAELAVIGSGDAGESAPAAQSPASEGRAEESAAQPAEEPAPEQPETAAEEAQPQAAAEPEQPAAEPEQAAAEPEQAAAEPEQSAAEAAPPGGRDSSAYVTPLVR